MANVEVKFRGKSGWQKDDCINPDCNNRSTIEAVTPLSVIRCCDNPACKDYAARLATIPH